MGLRGGATVILGTFPLLTEEEEREKEQVHFVPVLPLLLS